MSKRITFSDEEIEHIVKGLKSLKNQTTMDYPVVRTGQRVYQHIIDKLEPAVEEAVRAGSEAQAGERTSDLTQASPKS